MKIEITVPNGTSGKWSVESFAVSEEDAKFSRMRAIFQQGRGGVPAGKYKRLKNNGTVIMSNTPDEISDFKRFVYRAKGKVLVHGLGLGVLLKALLLKDNISEITVIEISQDVINLVAPTYEKDKRVTIINANAFTWKSPKNKRYDVVWHDIWDYLCSDNVEEMKKLHRRYGKKSDYQESWCRYQCEQRIQ